MSAPRIYDENGFLSEGYAETFGRLYSALLETLGQNDVFEVEVTVTDEETIRSLNSEQRGVDSVTDVLSFPVMENVLPFDPAEHADDIDPETGRYVLGDIVICYPRACEQAEEYGHSVLREMCYLFIHGMCHLFGFDHTDEAEKAEMRAAEERALSLCGITRDV